MKADPVPSVVEWVSSQPASRLFVTAITQGEILYGIGLSPEGKRRNRIAIVATAMFAEDFNDRILAFNSDAAAAYADIAVGRRRKGRPITEMADGHKVIRAPVVFPATVVMNAGNLGNLSTPFGTTQSSSSSQPSTSLMQKPSSSVKVALSSTPIAPTSILTRVSSGREFR